MRKKIMRSVSASAFATALIALSAPAAAADYLPSGVQTNVLLSTVTNGGWSLCYSGTYDQSGASIAGIAAGCTGTNMMLAARVSGSDTLLLLAQAPESDVMFDTGTGFNSVHLANDVNWYFNDSWSWGFARFDQTVYRSSCDISGIWDSNTANSDSRLCWHTNGGMLQAGWRAGADIVGYDYDRLVFTLTPGAVPEPASWAMMLLGFAGIGVAMRRSRKKIVALA